MHRENIATLFHLEGLALLGIFLVGYINEIIWLYGAYYFLLPLFAVVLAFTLLSHPFKKRHYQDPAGKHPSDMSYRRLLKAFIWFNAIVVVGLIVFIWWASGGDFGI